MLLFCQPAPAASSKKKEEEDFGPIMNMTVSKEQRVKEEKAMKVKLWNSIELGHACSCINLSFETYDWRCYDIIIFSTGYFCCLVCTINLLPI